MSKRLFEILDEMNVNDEKNKTATVGCCFDFVSAQTAKGGGHVIMGVPTDVLNKIVLNEDKVRCILLVIDYDEYKRLDKEKGT